MIKHNAGKVILRGGRMTKCKGQVASMSPLLGSLGSGLRQLATIAGSTAIALSLLPHAANAQSVLTWDVASTNIWNESGETTGAENWLDGATSTIWTDGSDAIFGTFGETVTVADTGGGAGTRVVSDLTFEADGYVVQGGTLSLAGTTSVIDQTGTLVSVQNGSSAIISSDIVNGTARSLGVGGGGTLVLSGNNDFDNLLVVQGSTLVLGSAGAYSPGNSVRVGGATLDLGTQSITTNSFIAQNATVINGTITSPNQYQLQNATISADLDGAGGISLFSGTVTLAGDNGFTGIAEVDAAGETLLARSNTALGSNIGTTVVTNGGTLALGQTLGGADITIESEALSLAGTLRNVDGNNTYSGPITLTGDSSFIADAGSLTVTPGFSLDGVTLTVGGAGRTNINGIMSDNGALTMSGTGTLALNAENTYAGLTTVNSGLVLNIGSNQSSGLIINGGEFDNSASFTGSATLNGGTLDNNTGGTIGGTVTNNGGTIQNAGFLGTVNNTAGSFVNEIGGIAMNVQNGGTGSNAGNISTLGNTGSFTNTGVITGTATNSGTLNNAGSILSFLNNQTGTTTNTGSVFAQTTITGGTVLNDGRLQDVDNVSGVFTNRANGTARTVENNATGSNAGTISYLINNGTFSTTGEISNGLVNNATLDASGTVSGAITNQNAGTMTITGNAVANGVLTNRDAATLNLTGGSLTGLATLDNTATVSIGAGGLTLAANVINNDAGSIAVGAGSTLQGTLNNAAAITVAEGGTVTAGGDITNQAGATLSFDGASATAQLATTGGQIVNDGTVSVTGAGAVAVTGNVVNQGLGRLDIAAGSMTGTGTLTNSSLNGAGGVGIAAGASLSMATINNTAGSLIVNQGTLAGTGTLLNAAGATITSDRTGSVLNAGTLTNQGTITAMGTMNADVVNTGTSASFDVVMGLSGTGGPGNATGDFANSNGARLSVNAGQMDVAALLNNAGTADLTSVTIATGAELSATGVTNTFTGAGSPTEAVITVNGTLRTGSGGVDNAGTITVAGLLDAGSGTILQRGTLDVMAGATVSGNQLDVQAGGVTVSRGHLNTTTLSNSGSLTVSGTGANGITGAVQNAGTLTADGDLRVTGSLTGTDAGTTQITAGTTTVSGGVTVASTAAQGLLVSNGAFLDAAEVTISAGATAQNNGTLSASGEITIDAGAVLNSNGATSVLAAGAALRNSGTANLAGAFLGDISNTAGLLNVTGTLTAIGDLTNTGGGIVNLASATTFTLGVLDNDSASRLEMAGGTLDGVLVNAGTVAQSGTVTGTLTNSGLIDLTDGAADGAFRAEGGLDSSGSYALDLDMTTGAEAADLIVVQGATTGTLDLQFTTVAGTTHLLDAPIMVVDVDEGGANDFTFSAAGLPASNGPIALFATQEAAGGDIFLQTGVDLSLGSILGGVAQVEALTSHQALRLDPDITPHCGGYGAWGRLNSAEASAAAELANSGQQGTAEVTTEYRGLEIGAHLGCLAGIGSGLDLSYNVFAGNNSGTSTQELIREGGGDASTTMIDFEQLYVGISGAVTNGQFTADAQLQFAQTEYDVDPSSGSGMGLTDTAFEAQSLTFAGSIKYAVPIGLSDFTVIPHAGGVIASTRVDDLDFTSGQTLSTTEYTSTTALAGVTVNYASLGADSQSPINFFAGATYYSSIGESQEANLRDASGVESSLTSSGIEGFGEVSIGAQISRTFSGGGQFDLAVRADAHLIGDVEGYNVALNAGFQF